MPAIRKGAAMYVEAFPAIDIFTVEREVRRGRMECEWTNEHRQITGSVRVLTITEDRLTFADRFFDVVNLEAGTATVDIDLVRDAKVHNRAMMLCSKCGLPRRLVYYVTGEWACKTCHGLKSITASSSNATKNLRRFLYLDAVLKYGIQKHQQKRSFDKLVAERESLKPFDFNGWQQHEYCFLQAPRWLMSGQRSLVTPRRTWSGYDWSAKFTGGFQRLRWLRSLAGQRFLEARWAGIAEERRKREEARKSLKKSVGVDPAAMANVLGLADESRSAWSI